MRSCSFTGHRVIEKSKIPALEALLSRAIDYVYSEGCRSFYCGGALGFDTIAAKLVIKKKMIFPDIRLIMLIPCANQSVKWRESDKRMYDYILSMANEVFFISEEYTPDCMKKRNALLVELADVLVAYSGRSVGGSAQTVRMASKAGKTVYNLYQK